MKGTRIRWAVATALCGAALAGCSAILGLEQPSFDGPPSGEIPPSDDSSSDGDDAAPADAAMDRDSDTNEPEPLRYTDISADQGAESGFRPSAVLDFKNKKLLVVTEDGANSKRPSLFRCNLDGTGCLHTDISAGAGVGSGRDPSALIDQANGKLLVVTSNGANSSKPSLFRCNLDGTSCMHTDISAGQGTGSGGAPSAVIDTSNGKLLVVTANAANSNKPSLFRCNLDGIGCSHVDISAGMGLDCGYFPSAVLDTKNGKLLVATQNNGNSYKPSLFRCNLDGTGCSHADISAGQGAQSGGSPTAAIDEVNGKLLAIAMNGASSPSPALFRCNLDGAACSHVDISAGQGDGSGRFPSAVVDVVNKRLLVVTMDGSRENRLSLFSMGY